MVIVVGWVVLYGLYEFMVSGFLCCLFQEKGIVMDGVHGIVKKRGDAALDAVKPYRDGLSVKRKGPQRGFTLIEIMVVIVILGILAGLIVPRIMGRPEEARRTKAALTLRSLDSALKLYKLDNGVYPSTEQGLEALVRKPQTGNIPRNWREGGYLEGNRVPKDPWGNDFVYIYPGEHGDFDLSSYGRDGQKGGEGDDADINLWELE